MIVVTSISPHHTNKILQHQAVQSWQSIGECYSLNSASEIPLIEDSFPGITFIETTKTIEGIVNKPLVKINAFIDLAIEKESSLLIVNSDIIIPHLPELKEDGITLFSRYDYTENCLVEDAKKFENGFDMFYIPNKFLTVFPQSIYALGLTWHDYWTPCIAHLNNIPTYYPLGIHALHKLHDVHYSFQEYLNIGELFKIDFNIRRRIPVTQVAAQTLATIKSKLITYG